LQQQHVTRVKLLKPQDTLLLGQAYRLITVAEVTKAMQANKVDKTRCAQLPHSKLHAGARTARSGDDSQLDDSLDQVRRIVITRH
jgi:hypothetical protein